MITLECTQRIPTGRAIYVRFPQSPITAVLNGWEGLLCITSIRFRFILLGLPLNGPSVASIHGLSRNYLRIKEMVFKLWRQAGYVFWLPAIVYCTPHPDHYAQA